jgi:AbrB family looped-hinge helix DNA binding protein
MPRQNPKADERMSITEMDTNGRIMLPLGIRYKLDLNDGDELAVDQLGDGTIILKKLAKRLRFKNG